MTFEQIVPWIISCISVGVAMYFGANTKHRAERNDLEQDATTVATIMVKLESISSDLRDIKSDIKRAQAELTEFRERLAMNEASIKSLHKRLDNVENHFSITMKE